MQGLNRPALSPITPASTPATAGPGPGPSPRSFARRHLARAALLSGGAAKGALSGVMTAGLFHLHTPRGIAMLVGAAAGIATTTALAMGARKAFARFRKPPDPA